MVQAGRGWTRRGGGLLAVRAVRLEDPLRVVVAAPVADAAACDELRMIAGELVCLRTRDRLRSASEWFEDFPVPRRDELRQPLDRARRPAPASDIGVVDRLHGTAADHDPVVRRAAETDVVLIGEASHGTHEFYAARAELTRRLIAEHGYTVVAVEADWPDAYRVKRISHDFHARLTDQFDLVIHLDETHALEPLDRTAEWETGEVLELYPWGV